MELTPRTHLRSAAEIDAFLEGLVRACVVQRLDGRVCALEKAPKVRYVRENRGVEDWQTALTTFWRKKGDCEDLAAWLAADCRIASRDPSLTPAMREKLLGAKAITRQAGPGLRHCIVSVGGKIFDPSRARGMGAGSQEMLYFTG